MKILHKRFPFFERSDNYTLYDFQEMTEEDYYFINEYYGNEIPKDNKNRYMIVSVNRETNDFKFDFYNNREDILSKYKGCYLFEKKDKNTFRYWFAHWCAYNMTALNMGIWKFKYLFHDFEKPWLNIFFSNKYKLRKYHKEHSRHHIQYGIKNGFDKVDWEALMIDWECAHYSKMFSQRDFSETLKFQIANKWQDYKDEILKYTLPLLEKYYM